LRSGSLNSLNKVKSSYAIRYPGDLLHGAGWAHPRPTNKRVLGEDRDLLMNYDRDEEGKENEQGSNKNSEDKGDDHETKSSNI